MEKKEVLYFGCWGSKGHNLWNAHARQLSLYDLEVPFEWQKLDYGFVADHNIWKQGRATLTVISDHTILSFPDGSVDSRPGSHSTFVAGGTFDFDAMMDLSKQAFGQIFKRYEFDIIDCTAPQSL